MWNHFLGGKDNYEVDRRTAEAYKSTFPQIVDVARTDRAFPGRAVRYLAAEVRIRRPWAITLLGILHFLRDFDQARGIVRQLLDAVPAGSHLKVMYATLDPSLRGEETAAQNWECRSRSTPVTRRASHSTNATPHGSSRTPGAKPPRAARGRSCSADVIGHHAWPGGVR